MSRFCATNIISIVDYKNRCLDRSASAIRQLAEADGEEGEAILIARS